MAKNVSNTKIDNLFLFYLHDSNFENRCVNMLKMRNNPYLLSVRFDSFNWSLKTGYSLFTVVRSWFCACLVLRYFWYFTRTQVNFLWSRNIYTKFWQLSQLILWQQASRFGDLGLGYLWLSYIYKHCHNQYFCKYVISRGLQNLTCALLS